MGEVNTDKLTKDIFAAETRLVADHTTAFERRSLPMSTDDVLSQYAAEHTDGDVEKLGQQLADQGYRLLEVVSAAKDNPYGYNEYKALEKQRAAGEGPLDPTKPVDYHNLQARPIGEEGLVTSDIARDQEDYFITSKVDKNYEGIHKAAEIAANELTDAQRLEIGKFEHGSDIGSDLIQRFAEDNLRSRGIEIGAEGYDQQLTDEYRKVFHDLMLLRTDGKMAATVRLAGHELADWSSVVDRSTIDAFAPQVRVLGIGRDNQLVYVSESKAKWAVDMADTPKMGVAGALKYGLSDWEKGVEERIQLSEEGYRLGKATDIPGAKYLGGFVGFVGDLLSPDAFAVGGAVTKGATALFKGSAKAMGLMSDVAKVANAPESLAVANELEKISSLFMKGSEGAGDITLIKEGNERLLKLRQENPALRKIMDRSVEAYQAAKTEEAAKALKSANLTDDARKAALDTLQAAGDVSLKKVTDITGDLAYLHKGMELRPGKRAEKVAAKEGTGRTPDVDNTKIFNYANQLRLLDDAAAKISDAGFYQTSAGQAGKAFGAQLKKAGQSLKESDPVVAKAFNKMAKAVGEVDKDILVITEAKAGIGKHTADDVAKAQSNVDEFMTRFIDTEDIQKLLVKQEKSEAWAATVVARNQAQRDKLTEARRYYGELQDSLKDLKKQLQDMDKERFYTEGVVAEVGKEVQSMERRVEDAKFVADRLRAQQQAHLARQAEFVKKRLILEDRILRFFRGSGKLSFTSDVLTKVGLTPEELQEATRRYTSLRNIIERRELKPVTPDMTAEVLKKEQEIIKNFYKLLEVEKKIINRAQTALKDIPGSQAIRDELIAARARLKEARQNLSFYKQNAREWAADLRAATREANRIERTTQAVRKKMKSVLEKYKKLQAKAPKPVPATFDGAGAADKLVATFIKNAEDAVANTFDYFYKDGPTGAALKQIARTRNAVLYNVRAHGEVADVLAQQLRQGGRISARADVDTSRVKDLASRANVKELLVRRPDLDPEKTPSALAMISQKFGVEEDALLSAIEEGKPLVVDGTRLDADYIGRAQLSEDFDAFLEVRRESPKISLKESWEGISADKPTDIMDRALHMKDDDSLAKTFAHYTRNFMIGGAVSEDLINLSPALRDMVQRIPRAISQTVGDVTKLLNAKDLDGLVTYLGGIQGSFQTGRPILSSGLPSVPGSMHLSIFRVLEEMRATGKGKAADAIEWLFAQEVDEFGRLDVEGLSAQYEAKYEFAADSLAKLVMSGAATKAKAVGDVKKGEEAVDTAGKVLDNLVMNEEVPMPRVIIDILDYVQPDYLVSQSKSVESLSLMRLLYNSGKDLTDPQAASRALIMGIQNIYGHGTNIERGARAVYRSVPIMAAHTKASAVIHSMADKNFMLTEPDYKNWVKYINGMPVPDEWRKTVLQPLIDLTGDTTLFKAVEVLGETRYIPKEAEMLINRALARAKDQSVAVVKGSMDDTEAAKRMAQHIVTKMMAVRVTGAWMFRARFGMDMIYEGFNNAFQLGGFQPAVIHTARMFSQVPAMFPGTIHVSHLLSRPSAILAKMMPSAGQLDGAPKLFKDMADYLAQNAGPEAFQNFLGSIGDTAANKIATFIGAGKWQPDVNKLLAGSDELVAIGDKIYSYKTLREMAVAEGVPGGSLQANYLATHMRMQLTGFGTVEESTPILAKMFNVTLEEVSEVHEMIASFAETLGERERMSMFSSFISSGYTPIEAARMTREALHDYQTTLSSWDYSLLVRLFIPFWGFTKNNNRLQLNTLLDPMNAYRAGIVRNGMESGAAFMQQAVNDVYMDELGVQTRYLDEERLQRYERLKAQILTNLGQTEFKDEQKAALRMFLLGASMPMVQPEGQFLLSSNKQEIAMLKETVGASDFIAPNPEFLQLAKKHQRGRVALVIPQDLDAESIAARRGVSAPALYNYLALPEPGQNAFFNHVLSMGSAATALALGLTGPVHGIGTAGIHKETMQEVAEEVFQPDFNPLNNAMLQFLGANTEEAGRPVRINQQLYSFLKLVSPDFVRETQEEKRGDVVMREKKYYLDAWPAALFGLAPVAMQGVREVTQMGEPSIGVTGEPVYDMSAQVLRWAGIQIERSSTESVMGQAQQSWQRRTYTPVN